MVVVDPAAPEETGPAGTESTAIGLFESREWWDRVARDEFIREAVRGHRLEFQARSPLSLPGPVRSTPVSSENQHLILLEVESLLQKGAVEKIKILDTGFYSNIFLVKKKDGSQIPVINLKKLNKFIKKKPFRMSTVKDVSTTLRKKDWAITIDLKDAYLHVPIYSKHRRFLKSLWQGNCYQFRRLTFGLTSAPRTFTRLTLPIISLCKSRGIRIIVYLDDFLVLGRSRQENRDRHREQGFRSCSAEQGRFPNECEEMSPGADTGLRLPGAVLEHRTGSSFSPRREKDQLQTAGTEVAKESFSRASSYLPGEGELRMTSCRPGKVDVQTSSDVCHLCTEDRVFRLGRRVQKIGDLVDEPSRGRGIVDSRDSIPYSDNGCIHARLGSDLGPQISKRILVSEGGRSAHQRAGVVGGIASRGKLCQVPQKQSRNGVSGQCNSSKLHPEAGWNEIQDTQQNHGRASAILQQPLYPADPGFSTRIGDPECGRSLQRQGDSGMVFKQDGSTEDLPVLRHPLHRPVRVERFSPGTSLLLPGQDGHKGSWRERLTTRVTVQEDVRLSSSSVDPLVLEEAQRQQREGDFNNPLLGESCMVPRVGTLLGTATPPITSGNRRGERHTVREIANRPQEVEADCMVHLRNRFRSEGTVEPLAEFLCGAWRSSTRDQYRYA